MTDVIERLTQDYIHFSKILEALEKQIQVIERGETPHVDLMVEIMDYIRNYVNVFLARKVLKNKDWKDLIEELPDEKLPEFEELWEQEYKILHEHMRDMD